MKPNRRNLYRILHVQPEAPVEVIRASVRTLLGPLQMHPDKGGDHDTAAMINDAWRVLGDPLLRTAYDRTLAPPAGRRTSIASVGARRDTASSAGAASGGGPECPFCRAVTSAAGVVASAGARCARCDAPLTRVPDRPGVRSAVPAGRVGPELFGRRRARRIARTVPLVVHVHWEAGALPARLHDLSFEGACFEIARPLASGSIVRIVSRELDALVQVIASRGSRHHARLLTVSFTRRDGVFVSETA